MLYLMFQGHGKLHFLPRALVQIPRYTWTLQHTCQFYINSFSPTRSLDPPHPCTRARMASYLPCCVLFRIPRQYIVLCSQWTLKKHLSWCGEGIPQSIGRKGRLQKNYHKKCLKDFIYLRKKGNEQWGGTEGKSQREKKIPCLSRKPDTGSIPGLGDHDLS